MYWTAIVDDEAAIRNGLTTKIDWASLGFRVSATFEDGEDVLQYLSINSVDVILTDIRMAVVSGLDVAPTEAREVFAASGTERDAATAKTRPDSRAEGGGPERIPAAAAPAAHAPVARPAGGSTAADARRAGDEPDGEYPADAAIEDAQRSVEAAHFSGELSFDRMARELYFSRLFSEVAMNTGGP